MNRSYMEQVFPSLAKRGGRDLNKNGAKPPLMERTGWLVQLPIIRWFERTTPSARTKEASPNLLIAQPPLLSQGGEYPFNRSTKHSFTTFKAAPTMSRTKTLRHCAFSVRSPPPGQPGVAREARSLRANFQTRLPACKPAARKGCMEISPG